MKCTRPFKKPIRWACFRWRAARRWLLCRATHPERFYDLVVQVAIIRPGPIVGQMMHPYMRRRQKKEAVTYPHPSLEPVLKRTLGVPLFQEQLLRMAMTVANFSGAEADELRRAVGMRRSWERMKNLEGKLRAGMTRNGIDAETQDELCRISVRSLSMDFPNRMLPALL